MSRLIRNYQSGQQIILSEGTRAHGTHGPDASPEERQRRTAEQILREAESLRQQAADQLAQAEQRAANMLQEAEESVAALQAEAQARGYEEGYQQGLADGRVAGEARMAEGVEQIQNLLSSLRQERTARLASLEEEVAALSMAIAEKVVGSLIQNHEAIIVHTVSRALAGLADAGPFTLRVHPDDRSVLETFWQKSTTGDTADAEWTIASDPTIERGGCILTCGPSTVDARISTQLRSLVEGLALPNYTIAADDDPSPAAKHGSERDAERNRDRRRGISD